MKKLACAFFLILSFGSVVSAQVSIRIKGGISYISPKDYNEAIQGRNAYLAETVAVPPMQGRLSPVHLGWNLAGEVVWNFKNDFGLGLGAGYLRFATDDRLVYKYPTTSPTLLFGGTWSVKTSVAVLPLVLKLHYALPLTKTVKLTAGLGPGLYFCSFNYALDFVGGYMGATDQNWTETLAARKTVFGFEGEVGLEIPVGKKIFAEINVGGRFAKLSDFTGDYATVGKDEFGPWDYKSDKGYWFAYDYVRNGKTYREYAINDSPNPNYLNFQKGIINLSGFFASAGIRVAL